MTAAAHRRRDLPDDAASFVAESLRRIGRPRSARAVCAISVPAPMVPIEALLDLFAAEDGTLWCPPTGPSMCGVGAAVTIECSGQRRYDAVLAAAEALWPELIEIRHPGAAAPPARLFGGFAFAPGAARAEPWLAFGDARFTLPRWCYGRDDHRAWLTVAIDTWDHAAEIDRWATDVARTLRGLAAYWRDSGAPVSVTDRREQSPDLWCDQIASIHRAIRANRCEKIVAARATALSLSAPVADTVVAARLIERHPGCYQFAFRVGGATFIGATPEKLIERRGDLVTTEALAGTSTADNAEGLMRSRKDHSEQEPVVRDIAGALRPLCAELDVPAEPSIRALRHVVHLETRISGRLAGPVHVLELVRALHPTPAVGGLPKHVAMNWIAEFEPEPRGWYAAPVGWFDAAGDGALAVAIRSGLLRGQTAYAFAGAGIVRDSDPLAELDETRLKQRPILDALGVVE